MPTRSKNSEYYSVIRGFYITKPTIFSSWGDVHPIVTGFSGSEYQGFKTLADAENYMDGKGVTFYRYDIKYGAGKTNPMKNRKAYYAVANGRNPGVREYYNGRGGAEPEVANFPGACHKHFRTEAQANYFISDWIEMFACVAKFKIKKALLDGHRPAHMQEWSLQFQWKEDTTEVEQIEHELADHVGELKLDDSE